MRRAKGRQVVFPRLGDLNGCSIVSDNESYESLLYPDKITCLDKEVLNADYKTKAKELGQAQQSVKEKKPPKSPFGPANNFAQLVSSQEQDPGQAHSNNQGEQPLKETTINSHNMGQAQKTVNRGLSSLKAAQEDNRLGQVPLQAQKCYTGRHFFNGVGQKVDFWEHRDFSQQTGQQKLLLEKPNSSGLHFRKSKSPLFFRNSTASLDCPVFFGPASISASSSSSNAFSEPIFQNQRVRLKGRLKNLKPKHKSDFLKRCIFRWEDTLATDGKLHFKKK